MFSFWEEVQYIFFNFDVPPSGIFPGGGRVWHKMLVKGGCVATRYPSWVPVLNKRFIVTGWLHVTTKGVGPSTTLAWSGWKQPDIAVEVDTARLETSRFKKCCENCVLLYYPSTEFKSAFNVYWHGEGAAGLSCTELSIWEFPFLRGDCRQGRNSIWYCVNGLPQKETLDKLCTPVCFRILSSSLSWFQFSLSAVTL
jgi:hypothetical protein